MSRALIVASGVVLVGGATATAQPGEPIPAGPAEAAEPAGPVEPAEPTPAFVTDPPPAPPPSPAPGAPPAVVAAPSPAVGPVTGFALEIRFETAVFALDADAALPVVQAGMFLGHRGARATLGVGLDLLRVTSGRTGGGLEFEQSTLSVMVSPGARFVLARSRDHATEALAQLDAGYGLSLYSTSSTDEPPSLHRIRVQAGPALRHWISPAFAVGATVGLRFERASQTTEMSVVLPPTSVTTVTSTTALFSSLQLTGVF